ncbi:ABC transporter permease [Marinobacterium aestuariivivens]|uniref:ABC transporter permease n=1 Tax=Marinobacterium aestuariivivens TaxID=1698799 RepID=A0ABW1ZYH8_9GAMM
MPAAAANRVIQVLCLLALAALLGLSFGSVQPNRIVPGTDFGIFAALGPAAAAPVALLGLVTLLAWRPNPRRYCLVLTGCILLLGALPWALAWFAQQKVPPDLPYARAGTGAAVWCLAFLLLLIAGEALQRLHSGWLKLPLILLPLLSLLLCAGNGGLEPLALMREYSSRSDQFGRELRTHLLLVAATIGFALLLGFALGVLASRSALWRRPIFAVVNFLQTIPSLALFGLLMVPLSYLSAHSPWLQQLGVRGIGWAPALLALIAYSLLPMVRNSYVALTEVPPALIEAARGMGMSRRQIFLQVRLPLALPVIFEGLRVTTVQAIGLTTVAALIGAGGLGTFVFQGLGQAAMDLVLLGAIPTILLALLADVLLGSCAGIFRHGGRA